MTQPPGPDLRPRPPGGAWPDARRAARGRAASRAGRAWAALLAFALLVLGAGRLRAEPSYDVRASLEAGDRVVQIDEQVTGLDEVGKGALSLWLYADRGRHRPPSFDEFTADRLFPGGDSRGGYEALEIELAGCPKITLGASTEADTDPVRGRLVALPDCGGAERPRRLRVRGALRLARRYGTLGRAADETSLGDPWYPLVVAPGALSPPPATHRVRLSLDGGGPRLLVGPGAALRAIRIELSLGRATHLPVFVLDKGVVRREVARGVELVHVTRRAPIPLGGDREDPSREGDPFDPDGARRAQAAAQASVALLRRLGFTASEAPGVRAMRARLTLVEIEERQRVAVALPGLVAFSDRAFRVIKLERVERFHRAALERQLLAELVEPHVRAAESAADAGWVSDLYGSLLADLDLEAGQGREAPGDIIGFAGFLPSIDQLLYAPQIPFRSVYFHDIEEEDPDRDGAGRALNQLPFGHLVLEKLRDRLGPVRLARAARRALFGGEGWRAAAAAETGESEGWFFDQWLARRHRVAYRLGPVTSVRAAGGGYAHRVSVVRTGEVGLREPVVVEVTDAGGSRARGVWDEAGAGGEVTIRTAGALENAVVDPDGRLAQDPSLSTNHPRFDDELAHVYRPPVLGDVSLSASVTEARPAALVDFVIKRKYDVRSAYGVRAEQSYRGTLGGLRYLWGLGAMRDLNSTLGTASAGVTVLRSSAGFGGAPEAVTAVSADGSFSWDTRRQIHDPATGHALSLLASLGGAHQKGGGSLLTASLAARGQMLFWPHVEHILALTYGAAVVRCPALPQSLVVLSGRQGFRGYETDELLGCAAAYGIFEERWAVVKGPYVSNAGLSWSHKLELVPFVGAGLLSSTRSAAGVLAHPYLDAGLGLRLHYDNFGIAPALLAIDLGVPLTRRDSCRTRGPSGECAAQRQPLGLYVSFEQTL